MSSEKYFYLALNDPLKSHAAEAKVFKMLQREPFLSQMTIIEIFKLGSLPSMVTPVLSIGKNDALNKTFYFLSIHVDWSKTLFFPESDLRYREITVLPLPHHSSLKIP